MVYDPSSKEQEKDIELWHTAFVKPLNLSDKQVVLFAHNHDPSTRGKVWQAPRALASFAHVNSSLDSDDALMSMRNGFDALLSSVAAAAVEKAKTDMEANLSFAPN